MNQLTEIILNQLKQTSSDYSMFYFVRSNIHLILLIWVFVSFFKTQISLQQNKFWDTPYQPRPTAVYF